MKNENHITKLEIALIVGIIGCLLLATWELGNLMVRDWLAPWVTKNPFTNKRVILYGVAFLMSGVAIGTAIKTINREVRFIYTLNRSLLWYGSLLLISTISIFVFDCLPEVAAGFIGAIIFALTIYLLQKKYYNKERTLRIRKEKSQCPGCGSRIGQSDKFCSACGETVELICPECNSHNLSYNSFCKSCGINLNKAGETQAAIA